MHRTQNKVIHKYAVGPNPPPTTHHQSYAVSDEGRMKEVSSGKQMWLIGTQCIVGWRASTVNSGTVFRANCAFDERSTEPDCSLFS